MGIVLYSTKRKGLQGVRIDDKINKTGFTFELGSNGKAQKDIIRNVAVISAFVRQSLYKKICKTPFFQCKDDVIYQIGE